MSVSQYYLNWDSHKNNICNGFSNLQQNEEFVDMTLAADGHLVNVHRSVLALASPYIKTILKSSPTPHPIVFLCNISHEVLNYILTYVYTGEVSIEVDKMQSFMKAAKDLQLSGLSNMGAIKVSSQQTNETGLRNNTLIPVREIIPNEVLTSHIQLNTTTEAAEQIATSNFDDIKTDDYVSNDVSLESTSVQNKVNENILSNSDNRENGLYTTADGYQYKLEVPNVLNNPALLPPPTHNMENVFSCINETNDISESNDTATITILGPPSSSNNTDTVIGLSNIVADTQNPKALIPEYTMSSRGSLQLILNRFMYYCHHQSQGGRKRRWRCIDYRKSQCPAFIDTIYEVMTVRKFVHSHPFHDEKIIKKRTKDLVYSSLSCIIQRQNTLKKGKS